LFTCGVVCGVVFFCEILWGIYAKDKDTLPLGNSRTRFESEVDTARGTGFIEIKVDPFGSFTMLFMGELYWRLHIPLEKVVMVWV